MKKTTVIIFLCLLAFISRGQNGGQFAENNSIRITHSGYVGNQAVVTVTNKQSCAADLRIAFGNESRVKNVIGLGSDTFRVTPPANYKIRAKTETNCGAADFGQVELTLQSTLPIKFEYVKTTRLSNSQILVEFKAYDNENGEDRFNIQLSKDGGRTFQTVAVVLPSEIQPNQIYKTIITVK